MEPDLISPEVVGQFVHTGARMAGQNLIAGAAGNVSIRLAVSRGFVITTRGANLASLSARELVAVTADGEPLEDGKQPSSELPLHLAIYAARPDVSAIIHSHSAYATAVAATHQNIAPFIDEMVYVIGGPLVTSEYAFPGTEALGKSVVAALGDRMAVLMANHGAVCLGSNLKEAFTVCDVVEKSAQVFVLAKLLGGMVPLSADVVARQREVYLKKHKRG